MRIALKIAYDGTRFFGYARQPRLRTVEGEVLFALKMAKLIEDPRQARFEGASRTDRGVSALGNVIAFDSSRNPRAAAGAFNAKARDVLAWAGAVVPPDFRARSARTRWYRYLVDGDLDPARLRRALVEFRGTHDLRNFVRGQAPTVLRMDSLTVGRDPPFLAIDVRARRFAWNLVRRIASAAMAYERGDVDLRSLRALVAARRAGDLGLAGPEPLTLMDVRYEVELPPCLDAAASDRLARSERDASRRLGLLRRLGRWSRSGRTSVYA